MTVRIGSNIPSLKAQRQLDRSSQAAADSSERLASGLRINRASDDAAGLSIASTLKSNSRVFTQAIRNLGDGISMLQIADDAAQELSQIVSRQMELAEQSANGVYSNGQRQALDKEAQALRSEYNRIVSTTSFNGVKLFEGSQTNVTLQAGFGTSEALSIALGEKLGHLVSDGTFQAATTFTTLAGTGANVVFDANGDGILDLFTGHNNPDVGTIRFGLGDGTFGPATSTVASNPEQSIVIDLGHDGDLDVITAGRDVFTNNGSGGFTRTTLGGTSGERIGVADINNDGFDDLVGARAVNGEGTTVLVVNLGAANGTFGTATTFTAPLGSNGINAFALGDLNGDGNTDVVTGVNGDDIASIWYGDGAGNFAAPVTITGTSGNVSTASIADFDEDGNNDILVSLTGPGFRFFKGNGDGTFHTFVSIGSTLAPREVEILDLNEDSHLDLVYSQSAGTGVGILFGNGNGTFGATVTLEAVAGGSSISIADLNGDGLRDIVRSGNGFQSVLLGKGVRVSSQTTFDLLSQNSSRASLDTLGSLIEKIAQERGNIGSMLSKIDVARSNLATRRSNIDAAASRIEDVDVSQEAAKLVGASILQKVGAAILSQANVEPELALKLLSA